MKYLIFDFDGVLGDTWDSTIQLIMETEDTTREEAVAGLMHYFEKPRHSRGQLSAEEFERKLPGMKNFATVINRIGFELFDGFIVELERLKDTKMAVVSSGSKYYVRPKLEPANLNFTHILAFEDHHSKEEKIELICKDWEVDVREVYYFTDTKTDVLELQNIMDPTKIIGCGWGFHGFEKLREVLPESQILRDFGEVRNFFSA